jgi:NAD(P)-dependent dehydrogenase (short-subunit alcohol dehydrogenase family)
MNTLHQSVRDLFELKGKRAIITGAGSGIGRAIALGLAEYEVDLALFGRTAEKLIKVQKEIDEKFSIKSLVVNMDVSDAKQVEDSVNRVITEFGKIDILVNSHGIGQWVKAEEMAEKDWDTMMNINLKGVFLMCQSVARQMIKQNGGTIVTISSISGSIANRPQNQAHYNTAKAGVLNLTKCLAVEWAQYNIKVNCVSPGYTVTPMTERRFKTNPEIVEMWKSLVPMGRMAEPIEMVGAVIFLSSDASSYITGNNIVVDGGYTLW